MITRTLIFGNLGRGTADQARRSWASMAAHSSDVDVICPVEVDEGDKGYRDHVIMRRYFPPQLWRAIEFGSREPILVPTDVEPIKTGRVFAGVSVHRQTPARGITYVIRDGGHNPNEETDSTHAAAGYRNGHRPALVRAALGVSWRFWRYRLRSRARRAHRAGRHFVAVLDGNDRAMVATDVHPKAVELFRSPPDLGLIVPARGWTAAVVGHDLIPTFIEKKHQGHRVTYTLTKEQA